MPNPKVRSSMAAWKKRTVGALREAVGEACELLAAEVARRAPVETGDLRDSVHATPVRSTPRRISCSVVVASGHALPVEYGDRDMAPRPFFRPAKRSAAPRMVAIVEESVRK